MPVFTEPNPPAIHYQIPELQSTYQLSSTTAKFMNYFPHLVLGESNLFNYDAYNMGIVLSQPFQNLLELLVELNELDRRVLTAKTVYDLNTILQQPQGEWGGLLRKAGTERWDLEDNPTKIKFRQKFEELLQQLGFYFPKTIDFQMVVDHCIIFGASAERMEKRIIETLQYLKNNLTVVGNIFLLGSNRKLTLEEVQFLQGKLEKLEKTEKNYWNDLLKNPELSTEANASLLLWKCTIEEEMQVKLKGKLIAINSTRIGKSYEEKLGHRVTTDVTTDDLQSFFKEKERQTIFALAEQPYIRLLDQLRFSVLTKGKKASKEELLDRISLTTFYFVSPSPTCYPLMSVVLDEIARNVYRVSDTLKYLNSLE